MPRKKKSEEREKEPEEDNEEGDETEPIDGIYWRVEAVLDARRRKHKMEYYISWIGYGPEFNEWCEEENLSCWLLVKQFFDKAIKTNNKRYIKMYEKIAVDLDKKLKEMDEGEDTADEEVGNDKRDEDVEKDKIDEEEESPMEVVKDQPEKVELPEEPETTSEFSLGVPAPSSPSKQLHRPSRTGNRKRSATPVIEQVFDIEVDDSMGLNIKFEENAPSPSVVEEPLPPPPKKVPVPPPLPKRISKTPSPTELSVSTTIASTTVTQSSTVTAPPKAAGSACAAARSNLDNIINNLRESASKSANNSDSSSNTVFQSTCSSPVVSAMLSNHTSSSRPETPTQLNHRAKTHVSQSSVVHTPFGPLVRENPSGPIISTVVPNSAAPERRRALSTVLPPSAKSLPSTSQSSPSLPITTAAGPTNATRNEVLKNSILSTLRGNDTTTVAANVAPPPLRSGTPSRGTTIAPTVGGSCISTPTNTCLPASSPSVAETSTPRPNSPLNAVWNQTSLFDLINSSLETTRVPKVEPGSRPDSVSPSPFTSLPEDMPPIIIKKEIPPEPPNGFQRGLKAERILTIMKRKKGLAGLVSFENSDLVELISTRVIRKYDPQLLLNSFQRARNWP